jgi:hypothetical protein
MLRALLMLKLQRIQRASHDIMELLLLPQVIVRVVVARQLPRHETLALIGVLCPVLLLALLRNIRSWLRLGCTSCSVRSLDK